MRSFILVATIALVAAPTAGADPPANDHNCAGVVVSSFAGPGFGQFVSTFAHLQAVDNFGLANCGEPPRNNP